MMKLSLLLLLLSSCSDLGSEARSCDTAIAVPSHILNLKGSEKAGAVANFLHAYSSTSLDHCLDDCCSGIHGLCSVATYKNRSEDINCLHFYCEPLAKCKFLPTTFGDSFTFPGAMRQQYHNNTYRMLSEGYTIPIEDFKSHIRSVTARKGAENVMISRKGVFSDELYIVDEVSLNNDNSSVKPGEGVGNLTNESSASNFSVISLDDYEDTNGTDSEMDLSKSIESYNANIPYSPPTISVSKSSTVLVESSSSAPSIEYHSVVNDFNYTGVSDSNFTSANFSYFTNVNDSNFISLNYSDSTTSVNYSNSTSVNDSNFTSLNYSNSTSVNGSISDSELLSVLQSVFQDELTTKAPKVPFNSAYLPLESSTVLALSQNFKSSSVLLTPELQTLPSDTSRSSVPRTATSEKLSSISKTLSTNNEILSTLQSFSPSDISIQQTSRTEITHRIISTTEIPHRIISTTEIPHRIISTTEIPHGIISTTASANQRVLDSTSVTVPLTQPSVARLAIQTQHIVEHGMVFNTSLKESESQHLKSTIESENERKYKTSMHLVISLVFGLLVLCTVMGVIAKRVYDLWMRRHYHRMDFLIDGLYDGYS